MKESLSFNKIACVLLFAAAGISGFLTYLILSDTGIAGCGGGAECSEVLRSPWAKIFGVPVAVLGGVVYLAAALTPDRAEMPKRVVLLSIPLAALWFVGVQAFAIKTFCIWCCAAHLLGSTGALILLLRHWDDAPRNRVPSLGGALAAVCGVALVQVSTGDLTGGRSKGGGGGLLQVYSFEGEGLGVQSSHDLPFYGNRAAANEVILLTDYTCQHCRELSNILARLSRQYGDVKIVKHPATRKGGDSELVHRYMLALWKADPNKHRALEERLFNGLVRAEAQSVELEATRLLGSNRLAETLALHGDWMSARISAARAMQDHNREKTGKGVLPQLVAGKELVLGAHSDPSFYATLFETQFAVRASGDPVPDGPGSS